MHVARDKQIDVLIFVIVCQGWARAESACCYASLLSNIFKFAIAQIVIERISAVAGHVDIGQAIIVVIDDGHAHTPAFAVESGGSCDVGELKISVLMVKRDHG